MSHYHYQKDYYIDLHLLNNEAALQARIATSGIVRNVQRAAFENLLRFLYEEQYPRKAARETIRNYHHLFSETENLMLLRLATRCSGNERFNYGINAVIAMKRDRYQCVVCGEQDVRCLEIDHVHGRSHKKGHKEQHYKVQDFQTLCANHHRIKTVVENQQN